ncbi:uncharacterized protein LOC109807165 [Cajanus cajan]|uniref:uncharacterized protein LOC109807165 n=1 Tax=Cajanus cajan TaxID=3821 RepID=UPI00098D9369|nr:uncharacterized protein LOC109807165 [Cajanus cajan]
MCGHWTNNCVRFRDMIENAITDGRLAFEEKDMKVDTDPFVADTGCVEPVSMAINMVEINVEDDENIEPISDEKLEELMDDFAKEEEPIYPKEGDSLVEFLSKKKEADKEVMLCPRCSAVFDRLVVWNQYRWPSTWLKSMSRTMRTLSPFQMRNSKN